MTMPDAKGFAFDMSHIEVVATENDGDSSCLADSGTESFTESPVAEEEVEQTDAFVPPFHRPQANSDLKATTESNLNKNILDRSISVDEDSLAMPLEPIKLNHEAKEIQILPSILRTSGGLFENIRKVSFPRDETVLAEYREPECAFPWIISKTLTVDEILQEYQLSCKRHQTIELNIITDQLQEIKNNNNRSAILNLGTISISTDVCETLEDLFKVVNFRTISINRCKFTQETIQEFLNMLEYYESTVEIVISENFEDLDAWKMFCNVIAKSIFLESVTFKGMNVDEQYMRFLLNAINSNDNITILKFDNCVVVNLPSFYLVENLLNNTTIRELYLLQTGLYTKEADCLGRFLSRNFYLRVLDISNNFIGDRGLEVLGKGLVKQVVEGAGLSALIIVNNQLTDRCGPTISNIITECKNLQTLNIGFNNLTDEVISHIQSSLSTTKSLEGLGLQSTLLTCIGVDRLAQAITSNSSLQKLNLKGNKAIQIEGLEKLSGALTNSRIIKVEIDDSNRACNDPQGFIEIVKKINGICAINKSILEQNDDEFAINLSQMTSRKVSLSCEPRFAVFPMVATDLSTVGVRFKSPASSIPSPVASPATRSRFTVFKVSDNMKSLPSMSTSSRFKVSTVPCSHLAAGDSHLISSPSQDDIEESRRFLNVRSSVSSTDSVESLVPSSSGDSE